MPRGVVRVAPVAATHIATFMANASPSDQLYKPGGVIVLATHSVTWAAAFECEASAVLDALSDLSFELHHIGSTAIPRIVAKPVIDMLGIVPAVEALDARAHRLAALGYESLGEFGITGRRYFRKNAADGVRTHQLHAFAEGFSRDPASPGLSGLSASLPYRGGRICGTQARLGRSLRQ